LKTPEATELFDRRASQANRFVVLHKNPPILTRLPKTSYRNVREKSYIFFSFPMETPINKRSRIAPDILSNFADSILTRTAVWNSLKDYFVLQFEKGACNEEFYPQSEGYAETMACG